VLHLQRFQIAVDYEVNQRLSDAAACAGNVKDSIRHGAAQQHDIAFAIDNFIIRTCETIHKRILVW
jgi:hypothetical protein